MTTVVATLFCDRKWTSEMVGLPAMLKLEGDCIFYANYETLDASRWGQSVGALADSGRPYATDYWSRLSSWHMRDHRDQDVTRLEAICIARNMARTYAVAVGASHLLFIDADVIVQPDTLTRLLATGHPLAGGYVHGRGEHRHGVYVFGQQRTVGPLIYCDWATFGCALIERKLFEVVPFRHGPHPTQRGVNLSEDPAFAMDARFAGCPSWCVDTRVTPEHWDDPRDPLTWANADNQSGAEWAKLQR